MSLVITLHYITLGIFLLHVTYAVLPSSEFLLPDVRDPKRDVEMPAKYMRKFLSHAPFNPLWPAIALSVLRPLRTRLLLYHVARSPGSHPARAARTRTLKNEDRATSAPGAERCACLQASCLCVQFARAWRGTEGLDHGSL